jgi:RNA polymerase sigma-70 factor (sigma-E family)
VDPEVEKEFCEFVAGSSKRLARLAMLLTSDPHLAQDLVQAALARAYLRWERINDNPLGYVRRTMINQRTDWWRRRPPEDLGAVPVERARTGDPGDAGTDRIVVLGALRQLTKRERACVVLRFYEDLSQDQIADELGIATGTVKSTLSRALAKLRVLPDFAPHLHHRTASESLA